MGGDGILLLLLDVLSWRNGAVLVCSVVCASYMLSAYALIWTLDGFRATERASCAIALLGLQ